MCRFIAYLGHPLILDDVLYKPQNSLIKQSIHARENVEPLNGDGFGMSWYVHQIDNSPAIFKTIQPAWNDMNLKHLAPKIYSTCFLAHVRAASSGEVNLLNTHPFKHKHISFMHNGDIGGFKKIKRHLRHDLSDEIYHSIKGQTDSEHFFAVFLDLLYKKHLPFNANNAAMILREALTYIENLAKKNEIKEPTYINAVVSDGKSMVAIRYVSEADKKPLSLYYSLGSYYEYHDGSCHMLPSNGNENGAVLIVSERLSSHKADWHEVPDNHILLVDQTLNVEIEPV
jgi:predicted glutamine amidotransferase